MDLHLYDTERHNTTCHNMAIFGYIKLNLFILSYNWLNQTILGETKLFEINSTKLGNFLIKKRY